MSESRRYRAFISYSHGDARIALWLHRMLEAYRVPMRLRGIDGQYGPVPERLGPIFRDREDLASDGDLGARVHEALADSDALIVICSPQAAASRWVNKEVLAFKRGGSARIYCLIVSGEPNSGDARECFPPAVRFHTEADGELGRRPAEPIAADLRSHGDGRTVAGLKLIAGLLGIGLDTLRRREAQRRHRRMLAITVAALSGMTLAMVLAAAAWIARNDAKREQARAEVARKDAQRRQAQAEDLLGFLLDDLHPKLEKVGRLDLLDTVNDKEMNYFASLDPADLTDALLARQVQALNQIGQVRLSQARYPEALASFEGAYQRSKALTDRHPGDGKLLFDRGQAEYYVGYVHWQSRDLEQAELWLTRYRDTCRTVYAIDPGNADWQHELAYGDHNLAVLELERGQLQQAADGFARSRTTLESILAKTPDDVNLLYEVADEVSWQGNGEEHLGHLQKAEALLASKSRTVRGIAESLPNDLHWKNELSGSELVQAELLCILGEYAQAEALADGAVARMQALATHDPGNKDWSRGYLRAVVMRAKARIGAGKFGEAKADLALAQPLLDAAARVESADRYARRDLLDALALRAMFALQQHDRDTAREAAEALQKLYENNVPLDSLEAIGRFALAQVIAGMAATDAGRSPEASFATARRTLEPVVGDSTYWRILDPWVRLSLLTGDAGEAERVQARLTQFRYVPLFPWPAPSRPSQVAVPAKQPSMRQSR